MIASFDISTKTGFAAMDNDESLIAYGTYHIAEPAFPVEGPSDYVFIQQSESLANFIVNFANEHKADTIVIEQTNQGKNRVTQKQLEFLHYGVLRELYLAKLNHKIMYVNTSEWRSGLGIKMSKDQRKHNKLVKAKTARGKITAKHLAVQYVNRKYGLKLRQKDNDQADAICMALYAKQKQDFKPTAVDLDAALT